MDYDASSIKSMKSDISKFTNFMHNIKGPALEENITEEEDSEDKDEHKGDEEEEEEEEEGEEHEDNESSNKFKNIN